MKKQLNKQLKELGGESFALKADVSDRDQVVAALEAVVEKIW